MYVYMYNMYSFSSNKETTPLVVINTKYVHMYIYMYIHTIMMLFIVSLPNFYWVYT